MNRLVLVFGGFCLGAGLILALGMLTSIADPISSYAYLAGVLIAAGTTCQLLGIAGMFLEELEKILAKMKG